MDQDDLGAVLTESGRLMDAGAYPAALRLLSEFDDALTAQPDRTEYGRLYFARFQAAFRAGDRAQTLALAEDGPARFQAALPADSAAWLSAAAAEAAADLGHVHKVEQLALRAIGWHRYADDPAGVARVAAAACKLLARLDRDDANGLFVDMLIESADVGDEQRAAGYHALCLNIVATSDPARIAQLLAGVPWLAESGHRSARLALRFAEVSPEVAAYRAATDF